MSSVPHERLHALDALRAVAMLLGILLHAALAYQPTVFALWPADDPRSSSLLSVLFGIIHLFRMETFFLLAGFFGCMVLARRGAGTFVRHRLQRIALPLAICMVTLVPLTHAVWSIGLNMRQPEVMRATPLDAVLGRYNTLEGFLSTLGPIHLWFLQHLLVLYALFLGITSLRAVPGLSKLGSMAADIWAWWVRRGLAWAPLTVASVPFLLIQDGPGVGTQMGLFPPVRIVAYYALYFGSGWLLYYRRDVLQGLAKYWWAPLLLGLVSAFVYFAAQAAAYQQRIDMRIAQLVAAPTTALLVCGFTGMFLRLCRRPSAKVRYVSDSAYWMYLVHLPLVIALNWAAYPLPVPAIAKFTLVCLVAFVLMLVSYHLVVRNTLIGVLLNGSRFGRPSRDRAEVRAPEGTEPAAPQAGA